MSRVAGKIGGVILAAVCLFMAPQFVFAVSAEQGLHLAGGSALLEYQIQNEGETAAAAMTEAERTAAKKEALDSYSRLGVVQVKSHLNVRKKAKLSSAVVGKMTDGSACEILKSKGDWYYISSGSVKGYVAKEYVLTGDEAREAALESMELKVQITTETLNVRTEPSVKASVWTQVDVSDRYTVVGELDDWIEIELDEDSTGYVSRDYVDLKYTLEKAVAVQEETDQELSLRQQIVQYAMKYLGNPYVWGGESLTNGCDCSGFTMLVYRHFGVSLPHYSVSQSKKGRTVSSSSMQPGDLVFYAKNGTINHVTMYIGNGQVIGAQSRRTGIAIRSWNYRTPVKIVNVLD